MVFRVAEDQLVYVWLGRGQRGRRYGLLTSSLFFEDNSVLTTHMYTHTRLMDALLEELTQWPEKDWKSICLFLPLSHRVFKGQCDH